jgi:hypothetical protein
MSAEEPEFTDFDLAYQSLLAKVWSDETAMADLLADPKRFAIEAGLPIDAAATVEIDRTEPKDLLTRTEILDAFYGTPGVHVLRVPEYPPFDISELTDDELDLVVAGNTNNVNNNLYNKQK